MAKLLVLVALACYAVHGVSCNRWFFKRAEALNQIKRQEDETKVCCLPSEFTLKADVVAITGYGEYKMESSAQLEMAYSSEKSSLYLSGSSEQMPGNMAAIFAINSDEVVVKISMGSCDYLDYMKFSDSYVMRYIQGKICIPPEISNFIGSEKLGEQDVEVFNLYNLKLTSLFPEESAMQLDVKMRAIRRDDGSCLPVQFEGTSNFGPLNTYMTLELQSLDVSDSVDPTKFDTSC